MTPLHAAWALSVTGQVALGQVPPGPTATPVVFPTAHALSSAEPAGWIAPRAMSSAEGDWGVTFAPRYATLGEAERRRAQDLATLGEALRADPAAHRDAQRHIAAREASVRAWLARLEAEARAATSPEARRSASDRSLLLLAEASTLKLQADLARSATPRPARDDAPADRVGIGLDLVVPAGDTIRHALAVGGDLRVDGTLTGDALALGGRVVLGPEGVVGGRSLSTVADDGRPRSALLVALGAYGALVPLALRSLAGTWVGQAAAHLRERPVASAATGLGVTLGLSAWALAALAAPWGSPIALALGAGLVGLASLGLAALSHTARGAPAWASAGTLGVIVASTAILPTPWWGFAAVGALPAMGAVALTGGARLSAAARRTRHDAGLTASREAASPARPGST